MSANARTALVRQKRRRIDSLYLLVDRERGEVSIGTSRYNRQNELLDSSDLGWMTLEKFRETVGRWQHELDVVDGKVSLMDQLGIKLSSE